VDRTAYTNAPSALRSRVCTACQRFSSGRIACGALKFELEVLVISSIIVSLALPSKLAKPNRSRYPILARELNAKFSTSAATKTNVPKANISSLFGCLSRSANKARTPKFRPLAASQPQLPLNHSY
jgi:hypothetical protein